MKTKVKLSTDFWRLFVFIFSLGVYFLVSLKLKSEEMTYETEVLAAAGLGLLSGELNSLGFYQSLFRSYGSIPTSRFLIIRLPIFVSLSVAIFISGLNVLWLYFFIGGVIALFYPQGRVSESESFMLVVLIGSLLKVVLGLIFYFVQVSMIFGILLLILMLTSQYLVSVPFHNSIKYKNLFICRKDLLRLQALSFIINFPILIYTNLGIYFYQMVHGLNGISNYYFYDRLIRGLGSTVIALQSRTHSKLSSLQGSLLFNELNNWSFKCGYLS
jgi:hypothetical protein